MEYGYGRVGRMSRHLWHCGKMIIWLQNIRFSYADHHMALQGPLGDRDFRVGGSAPACRAVIRAVRHDFSHVSCRDLSGLWDRAVTLVAAL